MAAVGKPIQKCDSEKCRDWVKQKGEWTQTRDGIEDVGRDCKREADERKAERRAPSGFGIAHSKVGGVHSHLLASCILVFRKVDAPDQLAGTIPRQIEPSFLESVVCKIVVGDCKRIVSFDIHP